MIRVLMGNENGIELLRGHTKPGKPAHGVFKGKTAVNHEQGIAPRNQRCVSFATTPEGGEAH